MLYCEFLTGTGTTENKWTFAEYVRINKIYTDAEEMSKEDAYKLYEEPSQVVQSLMEDLKTSKVVNMSLDYENRMLKKEKEELEKELSRVEGLKNSLQYTLEECLAESKQAYNKISDLIYG